MLGWPPETFWKATTWDVMRAQAGFLASKGVKPDSGLDQEDIRELQKWMDEVEGKA